MLTLFTTAKPFQGHNGVIQRNALQSWKLLTPDVEVIVFGDDEGSAEVCKELKLRHQPDVARTKSGAIRLDDMFRQAQEIARYETMCYANCDIVLMSDFLSAVIQTKGNFQRYLMVGRRWDVDVREAIDFSSENWDEQTRHKTLRADRRRDAWWVDYFAFPKGFFGFDIPPFAIGRTTWDNWLVWKGRESGHLIDVSPSVLAVHQNHDYGHHQGGAKGVWMGEEAKHNFQLAGGWDHICSIEDAELILNDNKFGKNPARLWSDLKRYFGVRKWTRALIYRLWLPIWHYVLGATRSLRTALGLRSRNLS
jgi:hypothetical protein